MTSKQQKRNAMLSVIYSMLPEIDNDYAAKLVFVLEGKKTLSALQQDIADASAQLNSDSPLADTIIAKMLLDECSLPAALRQVRIYNNFTSITELCEALNIEPEDEKLLLSTYASFSSRKYFDKEFEEALEHVGISSQTDAERATQALLMLLESAKKIHEQSEPVLRKNKREIFRVADRHHIPAKLTEMLLRMYLQPCSIDFREEFDRLYQNLLQINMSKDLCACIVTRVMLCQITETNAAQIAEISQILGNLILEEDLLIIACRYLRTRTPQDIASTLEAVLKKLPFVDYPEENLSLAVRVLLDGTQDSFSSASQQASLRHDREILRRSLVRSALYDGFEYDLAQRYGGKKSFEQLDEDLHDLLKQLPFFRDPADNKEIACKMLLGDLSKEEAVKQATYTLELKEQTLSRGIAPEVMKNYLGNKSPEELSAYFEKELSAFTFWKNDREKYLLALRAMVGELNGFYDNKLTHFILESLQNGVPAGHILKVLSTAERKKMNPRQTDYLIAQLRTDLQKEGKNRKY